VERRKTVLKSEKRAVTRIAECEELRMENE
jgi:hypothetical protein